MKKVIAIVGPTGVGKTSFSIELTKQLNTEIISGDSIQVYKGLDIGSGKITEEEKQGITHYLLDIKNPDEPYTVKDFQEMTRELIEKIDIPLIVGGTGLYLKAALYDYQFSDENDNSLTDPELDKYTNEELYEMLKQVDPKQSEKIHMNNRRRLLRSLTIYRRSGKPQSELESNQEHKPIYDSFIVGCTMPRDELYERINKRVDMMFEQGLKQEIDTLLKTYTFKDPALQGIGYKEWQAYYNNEKSIEEVKEEIKKHSRNYAKRQYTWFNNQMDVHWYNIHSQQEEAILEIKKWLNMN